MIELLYSKYYNELLNYCTSLSHNFALAEDVVQECFLRALSNLDVLNELSKPQCRAWLYRTAKNIFIDHVRRLAKQPQPQEELFSEDDYSKLAVELICCHLPEDERSLFLLRYIEGYNSREIGEMFDLPSSTVRAKLASARSRLRKILTQNE